MTEAENHHGFEVVCLLYFKMQSLGVIPRRKGNYIRKDDFVLTKICRDDFQIPDEVDYQRIYARARTFARQFPPPSQEEWDELLAAAQARIDFREHEHAA